MTSIKGTPKMNVTIVEHTGDRLVIDIEHADHQSYSRAVSPRAMKAAGAHRRPKPLTLVDRQFNHTDLDNGRGLSRFTFEYR
jgi:hypothetical protein